MTTEDYEEIQEILETLAKDGVGAVKPTAQHLLDEFEGENHTQAENTKAIEDFTVD